MNIIAESVRRGIFIDIYERTQNLKNKCTARKLLGNGSLVPVCNLFSSVLQTVMPNSAGTKNTRLVLSSGTNFFFFFSIVFLLASIDFKHQPVTPKSLQIMHNKSSPNLKKSTTKFTTIHKI